MESTKKGLLHLFKKKRVKKGLNSYTKGILAVSGFFQLAVLTNHIDTIINIYKTIIGLYMFVFVLTSIINILNGFNFSNKKSMITLVATYIVTIIQTLFGYLYIDVLLTEVATIPDVTMNSQMIISIVLIIASALMSIIATALATIFILKKTEVDVYF